MTAAYQAKKRDRIVAGKFTTLPASLFESKAWEALSPTAMRIFGFMVGAAPTSTPAMGASVSAMTISSNEESGTTMSPRRCASSKKPGSANACGKATEARRQGPAQSASTA